MFHLKNIPWLSSSLFGKDTPLLSVVTIIILYLVVRMITRRLIARIVIPLVTHSHAVADSAYSARIKTLAGLINSVISYVLAFVFSIMLLQAVHLDPVPLLTTASVAGLAVGFGAQKLVKDVISGFFILLENQYAIGEYVTIGGTTGVVEEVGMRTTRIRDDLGRLYIISNGDITQVCNQSRGPVETFIEISVAPTTEVTKATEIINRTGDEVAKDNADLGYSEPPRVQGISAMDAAKITFRVTCRTDNPIRLLDAQIALRGRARENLVAEEITLA